MTSVTWYRRSLWNYKGNREYTKSGYNLAKERFNPDDLDVDCSDRHYVITGCNSGIGLEIAREVAKRGGVLHMVCRNFESAKKARSDIITNTGNDKIHLHTLDLSKPRDVAAWAKEFVATHEKIHVLIHNAGCMVHELKLDEDGIETNFAVNTLAVHIITMTLLPVMQRNEDARVVTVSSAGMLVVRLDSNDLMHEQMQPFNETLVYSQNKRQQVVMTLWYAQRYDKVHFSAMHPGWADTAAVRNAMPEFYEQMKENLRSPSEGADTAIWLAISKAAMKYPSGFFFQDREPASTHLPLAWTKTSMEEENLLMQKLMILAQNVSGEMPQEEVKSNTDNISVTNSHPPASGVSSPVHSNDTTAIRVQNLNTALSTVPISKSEEIKHLNKDVDNVNHITEVAKPVSNEPSPKREVSTPDEVKELVSEEKVVTPPPESEQTEKEVLSNASLCEKEGPMPDEVKDPVLNETPASPQAVETKQDLLSRTTSVESKELEPKPTTDIKEEQVPESTTDEIKEEPVSEPTTDEIKEESVPKHTTDEIKEEPVPELTTTEIKGEQVLETTPVEVKGEPVIEELIPTVNDTASEVSQTISETQVQSTLETSSQNESASLETQESTPSLKSSEVAAIHSPSPTIESLHESSPSPDVALHDNITKEEEQHTSPKISDMKTPEVNSLFPSDSAATYQSAASVVEHLIDITAEKAAASLSS